MRYVLAVIATLWGIILVTEPALANCSTQTIVMPDGRVINCTICCYNGNCSTTCV